MPTYVKVKKWRTDLAVRIPKKFAKKRGITVDTLIDLEDIGMVKPHHQRCKLSDLLAHFKPHHRHGEWKLDAPESGS